jgi:riboflavin kinase/FMN adenylyltransferase
VVVGEDFKFGYQRRGTVPLLREMGAELGFEVIGLELVTVDESEGETYSSTLVRERLAAGDVEGAARALGRPHEVRGPVVEGDHVGREIGFPSAKIDVDPTTCLPPDGIYAGTLTAGDGVARAAALYRGRRPTFFADEQTLLEAYVLDWEGDLYGQEVRIAFVARIRGDEKFESVDAVVAQMHRDVEATRRVLAG